jgi:hypothetical protein
MLPLHPTPTTFRLLRDDVTWADWLKVRQRAHGRTQADMAAFSAAIADWPEATRLVASDPEQSTDSWWLEGKNKGPQPWLSLVRSLWVPPEDLMELERDCAWEVEGLPALVRWLIDAPMDRDLLMQCRSKLKGLMLVDLTRFSHGPRRLAAFVADVAPISGLALGGPAAQSSVLEAVIANHAASLTHLELDCSQIGRAHVQRLAGWPIDSPLRHLELTGAAFNLQLTEPALLPCLQQLVSLDLSRARRAVRSHGWLRADALRMLSLNGVDLRDSASALFQDAHLPQLECLRLASTGLNAKALEVLVNAEWSGCLTCLDLRGNRLPDLALEFLGNRPWSELWLSGNDFSRSLLDRFTSRQDLAELRTGVFARRQQEGN